MNLASMDLSMERYYYKSHRSRRLSLVSLLVLFIALLVPASVLADTPLDISTQYSATKTYTIQSSVGSNNRTRVSYQMYVDDSGNLTTETIAEGSNAKTDEAYLFAFVSYENDNSAYYLYSVKAKKFVTSVTRNIAAFLCDANSQYTLTPVYVYDANIPNCGDNNNKATYNRAIAFNGSLTFPASGDGLSNTTNNTNHVLQLNGDGARIIDWTYLGPGGYYNHAISETTTDFTADQLAEARALLPERLTYTPTSFADISSQLTLNTQVYTLKSETGSYLSATANALSGSTTADANAQFVFVEDPNTPGKIALYSVEQKRFITSTRGLGGGADVAQIYPSQTGDPHGYGLAFSLNETWGGGQVVNTAGSTSADPDRSNRFKLEKVTTTTTYKYDEAVRRFKALATAYTHAKDSTEKADRGITVNNKIYTISSSDPGNRGALYAATNTLSSTKKENALISVGDAAQQFVFIQDPSDASKTYLYNITRKKFVNRSGALVSTASAATPIYVYNTDNYDYVALSFTTTANFHENDGSDAHNNTGVGNGNVNLTSSQLLINNYSAFDAGNLLVCTEVGDVSAADLSYALINISSPFHYKGVTGRAFKSNGMQDVAEFHYYYYVTKETKEYKRSSDMHAVELMLPLLNYLSRDANGNIVESQRTGLGYQSRGNNMEPMGYFRWYDYRTDQGTNRIGKWDDWSNHSFNQLNEYTSSDGINRGLVGYNIDRKWGSAMNGPAAANIGVYYQIPDSAQYASWSGDIIACDVSRYADYSVPMKADSTGVYEGESLQRDAFSHEPTLSIRYIYHILPAAKLAAEIRDEATTQGRGNKKTYADNGVLSWGVLNESETDGKAASTMNLRADLQYIGAYWFYPLNDPVTHHVYHPDDNTANAINNVNQFGTEMKQATRLEWRVYNSDKTAWRTIASNMSVRTINICVNGTKTSGGEENIESNRWYSLNGDDWQAVAGTLSGDDLKGIKIAKGDRCYVVGYLVSSDNSKCPFFNAEINLTSNNPKTDDQITADNNDHRKEATLRELYGNPVAQFEFDNDNDDMNYTEPESYEADNNLTKIPSPFATRQYSFVYPQLKEFSSLNYAEWVNRKYGVLHGDYNYLKKIDVSGKVLTDRTNSKDKSRYGYFLFTDASDESRQLGSQEFEGNLCSGMNLVISAYVANASTGSQGIYNSEQPEVRFTLYGIEKDAQNNITEERPLASICSGNFKNNIKDYTVANSGAVWYQIYGVMTLPEDLNVERYTDFRVSIDNFCKNTWGADYAVDDISIYQNPSKLVVIQSPPVCREYKDPSKAAEVLYNLKGGYEVLHDLVKAGADSKRKVYYRFCTADGTPVSGENFYGSGLKDYGVAEIPDVYSEDAKLGAEDHDCNQFETAEGAQLVVLANRHFDLDLSKTYYLSVATKSKNDTIKNDDNTITINVVPDESSWGKPSDVCSFYSNMFTVVMQNLVIAGEENGTALVNIDCDQESNSSYQISAGITLPDHTNGGKIVVNTAKFDWFIGTVDDFNAIGKLQEALDAFRTVYPDATDPNQPTGTETGAYTEEYKDVLTKNVYPNGKLVLASSSSFAGYPIVPGIQTVTAIITSETLYYNGQKYEVCPNPLEFTIRAAKNGPRLDIGIPGIQYPASLTTRAIRLGLPQIRAMGASGTLRIPIAARYFGTDAAAKKEDLQVVDVANDGAYSATDKVYISATNDPSIDLSANLQDLRFANVKNSYLKYPDEGEEDYFELCDFNTEIIHEGYWYEINVMFVRPGSSTTSGNGSGTSVEANCPGETLLRIKVVPEYLTWYPTSELGLGSNWNNDLNWRRSTAAELFKPDYEDYRTATYKFDLYNKDGNVVSEYKDKTNPVDTKLTTESTQPQSYTPMYFSKVIIPTLTTQPYPMMGYIRRNATTGLVMSMTNGKGSGRTPDIEYDMMANAAGTATGSDSIYKCVVFDGNLCKEIWFKTGAQLRAEQYLRYQRAWCELALPVNGWGTFTSPMASSFAGEMYLPKYNARQETEGFREIRYNDQDKVYFDNDGYITYDPIKAKDPATYYGLFGKAGEQLYNRLRMPTYQMSWGRNESEVTESGSSYGSHDNPTEMLIYPRVEQGDNIDLRGGEDYTLKRNAWSHVFNDLSLQYESCVGMAGKIGDDYATPLSSDKWKTVYALMRLPKSDDEYTYYKRDGNGATATGNTVKTTTDHYRLAVPYDNSENSMAQMQHRIYSVMPNPQLKDGTYDYSKANRYVLMANPYTATISVQRFVNANADKMMPVERDGKLVYRVWTYYNNVLYELAPDGVSSIAPGQAFFIRVETPGKDNITFTERMQVDPNINGGAVVAAAAMAPKRIAYTVKSAEEVTKALSAIDAAGDVQMWSPREGWVAVSGATDLRISVYTTDGTQIHSAQSSAGATKQLYTGKGIFIVRATTPDGKTIARKLAVK